MENKVTRNFIISVFVVLYLLVSTISTIHVIDFFKLSNPNWLAVTLAIAFEVGAAASLASIIALRKMNKMMIWSLFIILTLMQAMGNTFYAYTHLNDYQSWIELFNLVDDDVITQKRILSLVSGAILPIVALGFIKSLVDYLKPDTDNEAIPEPAPAVEPTIEPEPDLDAIIKAGQNAQVAKVMKRVQEKHNERVESGETFEDEPTALANSGYRERVEAKPVEIPQDIYFPPTRFSSDGEIVDISELPETETNEGVNDVVEPVIEEQPDPYVVEKNKILDKIKVFK